MNAYEKPELKILNSQAEGVFMASGSASSTNGIDYDFSITSNGNPYDKFVRGDLVVKNTSTERIENWYVTINITSGTASSVKAWNDYAMVASVSGNQVIVAANGSNGALDAGNSLSTGFYVGYEGDGLTLAK